MSLPITISVSAETIAWYAAIMATCSVILTFLKYLNDRVNVVLKCRADYRIGGQGDLHPYKRDTDYVVITVINKGKRPITIKSVHYVLKHKKDKCKRGILTDSLIQPFRKIQGGESTDYLLEQKYADLDNVKYFIAYDATGRAYRGKLKR